MLPMMWNQPPCRNIDVSSVYQGAEPPVRTHAPARTRCPGGIRSNSSAGMTPSPQIDAVSRGSLPSP